MPKHSDAYYLLKQALRDFASKPFVVSSTQNIRPTQAMVDKLLSLALHESVNKSYLENSGLTEPEVEELMAWIDAELVHV
jgi:hypothetical protein